MQANLPSSSQNHDLGMRIALIYLGRRGAGEWISLELARQFDDSFPLLKVISYYAEKHAEWEALGGNNLSIRTYRNPVSALFSLLIPIRIINLIHQIRSFRPDVLLFPMFHPWNALIQHRIKDIPSVVFVHDPSPHPDLSGWFYNKLEQTSIRQAERCIILSENLRSDLLKRGIPSERIDFIPLGPFRFSPSQNLTPPKNKIPTLLFFGRIAPYKGLNILLQVYADIIKTRPVHLIIAGEGNLKPFRYLLNILPDIEIVNRWIPEREFEQIFSKSDLVILPYTSASQSGVIPIAASFGLPVIATLTGGIPEQIEDGISGWLVQPGDKNALVKAIMDALDHPDMARQRGSALRARYESRFNWDEIGHRVGKSLKKAMQSRGQK